MSSMELFCPSRCRRKNRGTDEQLIIDSDHLSAMSQVSSMILRQHHLKMAKYYLMDYEITELILKDRLNGLIRLTFFVLDIVHCECACVRVCVREHR